MNAQPQAVLKPQSETKEGTDFKDKLAKFINPFYVSFVIFWVVCNYDFLLILIGKKAILHELYAHFGYGCDVQNIANDGKIYTNYKLNLIVCVEKGRWQYAIYFAIWKVAIPLGLTVAYIKYYYPKLVAPLNLEYINTGKDVLRQMINAEVVKKVDDELWRRRMENNKRIEEERRAAVMVDIRTTPSKPLINKIL